MALISVRPAEIQPVVAPFAGRLGRHLGIAAAVEYPVVRAGDLLQHVQRVGGSFGSEARQLTCEVSRSEEGRSGTRPEPAAEVSNTPSGPAHRGGRSPRRSGDSLEGHGFEPQGGQRLMQKVHDSLHVAAQCKPQSDDHSRPAADRFVAGWPPAPPPAPPAPRAGPAPGPASLPLPPGRRGRWRRGPGRHRVRRASPGPACGSRPRFGRGPPTSASSRRPASAEMAPPATPARSSKNRGRSAMAISCRVRGIRTLPPAAAGTYIVPA